MKRFFYISLLTLALFTSAGIAYAQTPHEYCVARYTDKSPEYYSCLDAQNAIVGGTDQSPYEYCAARYSAGSQDFYNCLETQGGLGTGEDNSTVKPDKAAENTPVTPPGKLDLKEGMSGVMAWIMTLFAWLLGVASVTLDYAVYYTVVKMGSYINSLSAIGVTWRILRDIGNIFLIFGFLAIGISTILNTEQYGLKKMLPGLLAAAIFINFSLFLTEAVIDVGNLFATQFYQQIKGGQLPTDSYMSNTSFLKQVEQDGISNKIMSQLGLQTLYTAAKDPKKLENSTSGYLIGFMGILLFIVAAFVMFSLAFVLIARFVILVFLIVVAPVGFAGLAIPQLASSAKKWRDALIEQTITAPVLLLLLYIALAVITDAKFLTGLCSGGDATKSCAIDATGFINGNFNGFAGFILSFLVAMGLLMAVVIAAKKLSAFGAEWATSLGGKLSFGVTGWAVNRTVGRAAYFGSRRLRQSATFNKFDAFTGRAVSRTLDRASTGTFDVRGTKALKSFGVNAGEAAKDGFVGARKRNIEDHEKAAKAIGEAHAESKPTRQETELIELTTRQYDTAKVQKDQKQKQKDELQTRYNNKKAEVDRLAAIDKADRNAGRISSVGNELRKAQEELAKIEDPLNIAAAELKEASTTLATATKENENAKKASAERIKASTNRSKEAYAEGISNVWNPITFLAYGPDTAAAARKVKASIKEKGDKDKLADLVKKIAKEEKEPKEDGKDSGKTEGKDDKKKPDTEH